MQKGSHCIAGAIDRCMAKRKRDGSGVGVTDPSHSEYGSPHSSLTNGKNYYAEFAFISKLPNIKISLYLEKELLSKEYLLVENFMRFSNLLQQSMFLFREKKTHP